MVGEESHFSVLGFSFFSGSQIKKRDPRKLVDAGKGTAHPDIRNVTYGYCNPSEERAGYRRRVKDERLMP